LSSKKEIKNLLKECEPKIASQLEKIAKVLSTAFIRRDDYEREVTLNSLYLYNEEPLFDN
jgi:hypothetical protein